MIVTTNIYRRGSTTVALLAMLLMGVAACGGSSSDKSSGGEFVVGAVAGLTGPFTSVDIPETNSLKVGIEQVNAAGGINGKKIKLILLDDAGTAPQELLAVRQLVDKKVDLLVPDPISSLALTSLPFTTGRKILTMAGSSSPALGDPTKYPYNFTTGDLSSKRVFAVAQAVKDSGKSKVGLMYATSAAQAAFGEAFAKFAPTVGLPIVATETIGDTTDLTPELTKLKAAGTDVLVFDSETNNSLHTVMAGLQTIGWKVPIYVTPDVVIGNVGDQVPDAVKDQFNAVNVRIATSAGGTPAVKSYLKAVEKFGPPYSVTTTSQTDLVWIAKWAYETSQKKNGDTTGPHVSEILETIGTAKFPYADKMILWSPNPGFNKKNHNPTDYENYANFWAIHGATDPVLGVYPGAKELKVTIG